MKNNSDRGPDDTTVEVGETPSNDVEELGAATHEELAQITDPSIERVLSPEQAEEILRTLQNRFNSKKHCKMHEGINWADVEASLKANPEALWSLNQMESAGHVPKVYYVDESSYYFGTCSSETPGSSRNCVYDEEAADRLRENEPQAVFNGSAVEMAKAMGIELMSPEHYSTFLIKSGMYRKGGPGGKFDRWTRCWLLTDSKTRSMGSADSGNLFYCETHLVQDHDEEGGWRGSLRVEKVKA
jgi:hypothetical protein